LRGIKVMKVFGSRKAQCFTESVIREMTRVCIVHQGINLAQGYPDFSAPEIVKNEAVKAIGDDFNQYSITWGTPRLRRSIADKFAAYNGVSVNPEEQITVCCGSTEGMISSLVALVDPGEEVIIFEPFYENYGPDTIICGATPRYVTLHEPDWHFDEKELAVAFSDRTKAIIINTPNNPTGKVFTKDELEYIAALCQKWGAVAITDEIYEHILYDGATHVSMASLPGMEDHTVTINSISKTYSLTGWRVGWVIAPSSITASIRKVHDFLTVGAPHPLQEGAALALTMAGSYYEYLAATYKERRDILLSVLEQTGFKAHKPAGAYYIMTDLGPWGWDDDVEFALMLIRKGGVATVPGSAFYHRKELGKGKIRFCFPKKIETLNSAAERLRQFQP
jgi:aspartate/methionine/tyrosine aminotransferase